MNSARPCFQQSKIPSKIESFKTEGKVDDSTIRCSPDESVGTVGISRMRFGVEYLFASDDRGFLHITEFLPEVLSRICSMHVEGELSGRYCLMPLGPC